MREARPSSEAPGPSAAEKGPDPSPARYQQHTPAQLRIGSSRGKGARPTRPRDLMTVDVGAGDHVLVYGASGAIGSAAVQLFEHREVTVTAVCDARGTDLVASLGADTVIDYTAEDFTHTDQRFDVVLDDIIEAYRYVESEQRLVTVA